MTTQHASGSAPGPLPDWTAPNLLAGRGWAGLIVAAMLVLIGAFTDTQAFKSTLELALPDESETVAWLMAAGATAMALLAAAFLGITVAIQRRTQGRRLSMRLRTGSATTVWTALGVAMFLVRWLATSASGSPDPFGSSAPSAHPTPLVALFFAAIYLISGSCTTFEAERLYNPEYHAFRRLRHQYQQQVQKAAEADATVVRARSAVDLHDADLDREDHRRQAAIADRQALGAEIANYARILMAIILQDPAKTGLTEAGPTPQMPAPPGNTQASPGPDESRPDAA